MHSFIEPIFAVAQAAPAGQQPGVALVLLYFSTIPTFVISAVEGHAIGWGVFQFVWLALGIWLFWRWTDGVRNGVRLCGIYVVYSCLNLMSLLIYLIVSEMTHSGHFMAWPVIALVLALVIAVTTVNVIRGFPERPEDR